MAEHTIYECGCSHHARCSPTPALSTTQASRRVQVDGDMRRFRDGTGVEWEVYGTRVGVAAGYEPRTVPMLHFRDPLSGRTGRASSADSLSDLNVGELIEALERAELDDTQPGGTE